jgi:hypothetical protein
MAKLDSNGSLRRAWGWTAGAWSSAAVTVLALGCGSPPPPSSAAPPTKEPSPPAGTPPEPPSEVSSPGVNAATSPASPAARPKNDERSPLYVVATADPEARLALFKLQNKLFVGGVSALAEARGDELLDAGALLPKLGGPSGGQLKDLVGRWPEHAYAAVETYDDCSKTYTHILHYGAGKWASVKNPLSDSGSFLLAATDDGRLAAVSLLHETELGFPVRGKWAAAPTLSLDGQPPEGLTVLELVAQPSGNLFVLAEESQGEKRSLVATTDPKHPSKLALAPLTCADTTDPLKIHGLVLGGDGRVHAYGQRTPAMRPTAGFWSIFDGKQWHCQDVADVSSVVRLAVGPNGSATMIARDADRTGLWHRITPRAWKEYSFPRGLEGDELGEFTPEDIEIVGEDDLWIRGRYASAQAVLHSRPTKSVFRFPPLDEAERELATGTPLRPTTAPCSDPKTGKLLP